MTDNESAETYWCVFCNRGIPMDEYGVVVHDDVPHPEYATYDEEDKPQ